MVLEGASSQDPQDPYASDSFDSQDAYGYDDAKSIRGYRISQDNVVKPDPLTMLVAFFGKSSWENRLRTKLYEQVDNTRVLILRPPTQAEMDALVNINSRSLYYSNIGYSLGLLAGLGHGYRDLSKIQRQTGKNIGSIIKEFLSSKPFQQASSRPPDNPMASPRFTVALAGVRMMMWMLGFKAVSSVYATFRQAFDVLSDPRLSNFKSELMHQDREQVRERARAVREGRRNAQRQADKQDIPESPQSGAQEEEYSAGYHDTTLDQTRETPYSWPSAPRMYGAPAEQATDKGFFDDDASPTAPEYRNDALSTQSSTRSPPLSAWDRIRQQNTGSSQGPRQYPRPQQQTSDQTEFSSYASEKQSEREQAQADFDKMLESERRMSDS